MAVERSAAALLHWSWWRRWHQAWAGYYHYQYRKQERRAPHGPGEVAECESEDEQVPDTEEVWRRLEPLLASAKRSGRPYSHERRLVLEAIVYVMQMDCGWQALPSRFPPWKTVYAQYTHWRKAGIWGIIWAKPSQLSSSDELQL